MTPGLVKLLEAMSVEVKRLRTDLDQLKQSNENLKYVGVYRSKGTYAKGNFVTHEGSLWHANRDTSLFPGKGNSAWTLAVKRGAPGEPGRDFRNE